MLLLDFEKRFAVTAMIQIFHIDKIIFEINDFFFDARVAMSLAFFICAFDIINTGKSRIELDVLVDVLAVFCDIVDFVIIDYTYTAFFF